MSSFFSVQSFLPNLSALRFVSPALPQFRWMVLVVRKPHIFQVFQSMVSVVWKRHVWVCLSQSFLWLYNSNFFLAFEIILLVFSASGCVILKLDNFCLFRTIVSVVWTAQVCCMFRVIILCASKTTWKLPVLDGFYLLWNFTFSSDDSTPLGLACYGVSSSYPSCV
jgi:hypothetical protein